MDTPKEYYEILENLIGKLEKLLEIKGDKEIEKDFDRILKVIVAETQEQIEERENYDSYLDSLAAEKD